MKKGNRLILQFIFVMSSISLMFVVLSFTGVTAASVSPSLDLSSPVVDGYSVTVNGLTMPGASGTVISRINWNWGDGSSGDSWFAATHTYSNGGTFTITVTSYQSDGLTTTKTTEATISGSASQPSPTKTDRSLSPASTIDSFLSIVGVPADTQIVKINVGGSINLSDPLVILGSGIDTMENQLFQAATASYCVNSSRVLNDKTRSFDGEDIESYDLVVVGGPDHNAYTKELLGRGILKYNATNLKTPGLLVETENLPGGHTVVIVADTAGYPYEADISNNGTTRQPSPNNQTTAADNTGSSLFANTLENTASGQMDNILGITGELQTGNPTGMVQSLMIGIGNVFDRGVEGKNQASNSCLLQQILSEALNDKKTNVANNVEKPSKNKISDEPGIIKDMGANLG